jgi:hypothetical protein
MKLLLLTCSLIFGIIAYAQYFKDTIKESIQPNRWSWLIWSVSTLVEALTYGATSGDFLKAFIFYTSAACCLIVTSLIWLRSTWQKPSWTEFFCVFISIFALILWLYFRLTVWAHLLTVIALPVGFIPTWQSAWKNFLHENSLSWLYWTVGDFLAVAFVLSRLSKNIELPFVIMEALCQGAVLTIIILRKRKARKMSV